MDLASVRRLSYGLARRRVGLSDAEIAAAATEIAMVLAVVTGVSPEAAAFSSDDVERGLGSRGALLVDAQPGVARRDSAADRLLALGYSPREAADVIGGRISRQALDNARRMIAVGGDRQTAADYLDSQYSRLRLAALPRPLPGGGEHRVSPTAFDAFIDRYAALHKVESAVVRAIIAAESNFNPTARSRAGALGLMQLMPATARELGVNPLVPEQNIEGGVRYFAQLLKMFGTLDLALVAYNAGPGFAERYARGQTGLYGETRDYVARVLRRLGGGVSAGPETR